MRASKWNRVLAVVLTLVMGFTMTSTVGFAGTQRGDAQPDQGREINLVTVGNSMSNGYGMPDFVSLNGTWGCGFSTHNNFLDEESVAKYNAGKPEGEQFSLEKWARQNWQRSDEELNQWIAKYGDGPWTAEAARAWNKVHYSRNDNKDTRYYTVSRMSESAYPWQLKKYLESQEGISNVNLTAFSLNGMRTDELRAYLDEEFYKKTIQREHDYAERWIEDNGYDPSTIGKYKGFMNTHIQDFGRDFAVSGATETDSYEDTSAYVRDCLKNADVIVIDPAVNNFGSYVGYRFSAKMHMGGWVDNMAPNTYETIKDIDDIPPGLAEQVEKLMSGLTSNVEMMNSPMVQELVNGYIYGTVDCIVNHRAAMEWIQQNKKPGAKVIAAGINNSMSGVKLNLNGQIVDFGNITGKLFDLVNVYIKGVDKNAGNYYYADVPADLSAFIDSIGRAESFDALMADEGYSMGRYAVETLSDSLIRQFMDGTTAADLPPAVVERIEKMLYIAAHDYSALDIVGFTDAMSNYKTTTATIYQYMTGQIDEMNDGCWNLIHFYARFMLANCFAVHPNRVGCDQKYEAMKAAYESDTTGYEQTKEETMAQLKVILEEIRAMLAETSMGEDLDALVEKINMASELLAVLDDSGLTREQLEELLVLKDRLTDATDAVLDALGLTMEDLYKAAQQATEPENVQKVAEQLAKVRTIIDKLPKTEEEAKAELQKQLDNIDKILEENALGLSEELLEQLKNINKALKEAVNTEDYSKVAQELLPIGQKLLAIGQAVAGLPEYEEAMEEWMQANDAAIANLTDRVDALETMTAKLTAKSIYVDLKPEVTFPDHGVTVTLKWTADEDADGYLVTRNGEALEYVDEQGIMTVVDTGKEIGTAYTYAVTPYVVDQEGVTVFGNEYSVVVTPEVNLAKAKITNFKKGKTSFKVTWKAVKGADGYQISYKTGKDAKVKNVSAKKLSATVKGLKANKKYTVKVRAYKTVNDSKYFGAWSKSKSFKTKK